MQKQITYSRHRMISFIILICGLLSACGSDSGTLSGAGSETVETSPIPLFIGNPELRQRVLDSFTHFRPDPRYISRLEQGHNTAYLAGSSLGNRTVFVSPTLTNYPPIMVASMLVHEQCHSVNNHTVSNIATEAVCLRQQAHWLQQRNMTDYAALITAKIGIHGS